MIFGNGKPKNTDWKALGAALARGGGAGAGSGAPGNRPSPFGARRADAPGGGPKKGCGCTGKKVVPRLPR